MSALGGLPQYAKPWKSTQEQIALLESRGLDVPDKKSAEMFLSHLGYYRFSGYCLAFEDARHKFQIGTRFESVKAAYEFDVSIRDALSDALEAIEVDVRSAIACIFGNLAGAFGHLNHRNFRPRSPHEKWLERVREDTERSSELFVLHFNRHYSGFPDLPCWIATEVMSFGTLSRMFELLSNEHQKPIANRYGMQQNDLQSILHHFSYVRNICAHHARLWDRTWAITSRLPHGDNWQPPLLPRSDRLFATLLLINRILQRCKFSDNYQTLWRRKITEIVKTSPPCANALAIMGMPTEWYKHPYWN